MHLINKIKNRLTEIRFRRALSQISEYKNIEGWLSEREAFGLYDIAARLDANSTVVEIGSWKGKSTYCLAKGLKDGMIFAIDPFNAEGEPGSKEIYEQTKGTIPLFEQFQNTFRKHGLSEKVQPLMGYSNKFIDRFSGIDFLFIDGDHSIEGCDFDYVNYAPKLKKGGYLAFHDFNPNRDELGPTWVIKNKILNNPDYKIYDVFDSLWVATKVE
jgi:predicted O-methyltransferase YrrM